MARAQQRGVGMLELVIAVAVFGLLAALVGSMVVRAHRLTVADDARLGRTLRTAATVDAIRFELARAGWGIDAPSLHVAPNRRAGEEGHVVAIAFVEDRWRGDAARRHLALTAGRDARGLWSLYRSVDDAPRQPVVAGLRALTAVRAASEAGWIAVGSTPLTLPRVHAVELELAFVDGPSLRIVAPLRTPQAFEFAVVGG